MRLLNKTQSRAIQRRHLEVITHECDDDHILVIGELRDRRLVPTTTLDGGLRQAGTVHHMRIAIKVAVATLVIEDIEAELPAFPHDECAEMNRSLEKIKGLILSPGFTAKVRSAIGGRKGCIHLTTLLLAMAPAALQGYWVHNDRNPDRRHITAELMERYLIDTCWVWRREGPLVGDISQKAGIKLKKPPIKSPPDSSGGVP